MNVLITGIAASGTAVDIDAFSTVFHQLIVDQTNIGWTNIVNGRWSVEWEKMQKERSATDATNKHHPWMVKIINHIWEQWFASWTI